MMVHPLWLRKLFQTYLNEANETSTEVDDNVLALMKNPTAPQLEAIRRYSQGDRVVLSNKYKGVPSAISINIHDAGQISEWAAPSHLTAVTMVSKRPNKPEYWLLLFSRENLRFDFEEEARVWKKDYQQRKQNR